MADSRRAGREPRLGRLLRVGPRAVPAPVRAVADPWITLAAVAVATERLTIGPLVTPLARRRPHKLARETVTLDRLSGGRLVLGVGLGWHSNGEFDSERFGEEEDPRARARAARRRARAARRYWDGEFEPPPVQQPRIPVWVAGRWPKRRPLARAARWDGLLPDRPPRARGAGRGGRGGRGRSAAPDAGAFRPRRDQPARHGPGTLGRGRRHLVPDRLRHAARARRGRARDRRAQQQ